VERRDKHPVMPGTTLRPSAHGPESKPAGGPKRGNPRWAPGMADEGPDPSSVPSLGRRWTSGAETLREETEARKVSRLSTARESGLGWEIAR
jgi:hypothetical protein